MSSKSTSIERKDREIVDIHDVTCCCGMCSCSRAVPAKCCTLGSLISPTIKLTTITGIAIIILDVLLIMESVSINELSIAVKNAFSIANAILFSASCALYVFKFNEDVIKNDIVNLLEYYWNSDLRVRGLEIIEATESLGFTTEEIWEFRDSMLYRVKLRHFGIALEILFFYFNAMAYAVIYHKDADDYDLLNSTAPEKEQVYVLNLYISIVSPVLSIMFSYITVLCDNVVVVKDYVKAIKENRDKEDELIRRLKIVIRYPFLSIFMNDDNVLSDLDTEPIHKEN